MSNRLPTLFERQVEFQQKNGKSQIHLIYPWPGNFFKFLFQRCIWETGINLYPIISLKSSTLPCISWLIFLYFNECILAGKKGYCRRKERKLRHNKPRWNVKKKVLCYDAYLKNIWALQISQKTNLQILSTQELVFYVVGFDGKWRSPVA